MKKQKYAVRKRNILTSDEEATGCHLLLILTTAKSHTNINLC